MASSALKISTHSERGPIPTYDWVTRARCILAGEIDQHLAIRRASVFVFAILSFIPPLNAQERIHPLTCMSLGPSPPVSMYSFLADRDQVLCVTPTDDADGTLAPCLRIGRIHIGQPRTDVERVRGRPWRTVDPGVDGNERYAYLLFRDSAENRGAYYVIEYERLDNEQIVYAVQLTGDRPESIHQFSCLQLEDHQNAVRRQLARPSEVTSFEALDGEVEGKVWWYPPGVSIEIVKKRIYSFRVWRPADIEPKKRRLSLLKRR